MMICRKTMKECTTTSMCAPFQGCGPLSVNPIGEIIKVSVKRSPQPNKDEIWHVKLQGATALLTRLVTDVTPLTIELAEDRYSNKPRYRQMDIEMVERVK